MPHKAKLTAIAAVSGALVDDRPAVKISISSTEYAPRRTGNSTSSSFHTSDQCGPPNRLIPVGCQSSNDPEQIVVDQSKVELNHDIQEPSSSPPAICPVELWVGGCVFVLDNGGVNPSRSGEGHHCDKGVSSSLIHAESLPVEEDTRDQVAQDLDQRRDQGGEGSRSDRKVQGEVRPDIR